MSDEGENERRARVSAAVDETLAEGSWPKVTALFAYPNKEIQPTSDEEVSRLKGVFDTLKCPHIAAFVELVHFEEKQLGCGIQLISIQLVPRDIDVGKEPTFEQMKRAFAQKDIQAGSRHHPEQHTLWWLSNIAEGAQKVQMPGSMLMLDHIFAEVVELMKRRSESMTVEEMLNSIDPDDSPPIEEKPELAQ